MPNARELYNKIFDDFIHYGDPALYVLLDHKSDGKLDWFRYIWGNNHSGPDKTFLVRILHYFSLEQQDDREKIIQRLKTEAKAHPIHRSSKNDSDHTWVYALLLFLDQALHEKDGNQIRDAFSDNIDDLNTLLKAYESSIGSTYILAIDDISKRRYWREPHALFLRTTAEFMFSLAHVHSLRFPFMFLNSAYYAVKLYASNKHNLPFSPLQPDCQSALNVRDSRMYYRAALDAYQLSLKNNDFQTAYDVLSSWLNKKSCGPITYDVTQHSGEDQWRTANQELVANLQSTMSLLCARLSNLHAKATSQRGSFRSEAIHYAKGVLEGGYFDDFVFCSNLAVLMETGAYDDAARIAARLADKKTDKKTDKQADYLIYLTTQLAAEIGVLCHSAKDDLSIAELVQRNDSIRKLQERIATHKDVSKLYKFPPSLLRENKLIIDICRTFKDSTAASLLLCIRHLVTEIKRELRYTHLHSVCDPRTDASKIDDPVPITPPVQRKPYTIAYYTTLSNLKYLMEPVYTKDPMGKPVPLKDLKETVDPQQAKNCLTMMHAHYMNDPSEGITLPESLSDWINENSSFKNLLFRTHTPPVFRERLLDQSFVFLKSFTDAIDQLNMWSIYASDRSSGSDSNGCCVCLAPETFEMMLRPSRKMSEFEYDDMQLYKVAYLRNNNIVNYGQPKLKRYFRLLKKAVQALNDTLAGQSAPSRQLLESAVSTLQQILTPIIFLFKDASYRAEHELRLIVTRSREKEDMERISKTPQDPPKLYVNPYHQVFVDQIILGPKVNQPDNWIPHLQFELAKMWEKWPTKNGEKRVPSVRKSSINYRD